MLDRNGFKRKNYAELVSDMQQKAKELYGEDVNLSAKSFIGILIMLFAWFLSKSHELAERVYYSASVRKAEGVQLDYLTPLYNTSRHPEQYATALLSIVGTPNFTVLEGTRFETDSGLDFALTQNVTLNLSGSGFGKAVCLTPGYIGNVGANTITVMSEPSSDIQSVNNPDAAVGGRDEETDNELKPRLLSPSKGSATPNAILSAVKELAGVRSANIEVNNSSVTVGDLPPKSFQVFTLGGNGQEIAEAIFSKGAGGIEPYGVDSYVVKDISGNEHTVCFTPATAVPIVSDITLKTDYTFEIDGEIKVKNAVISAIGGMASDGTYYAGLGMGEHVVFSKILAAIMGVQGVTDANVSIGKTEDTLSSSNIVIHQNEVAEISIDDINVVIT